MKSEKYRKGDNVPSDAEYWAGKTMEESFEATCFLVRQYIRMNNLPTRMDKTVFEKVDKHKEWDEEKKIWDSFTEEQKNQFYKLLQEQP